MRDPALIASILAIAASLIASWWNDSNRRKP